LRDNLANGLKRSASVRSEKVVGSAREAIISPTRSVRRLVQKIEVSSNTAWNICHDDLFESAGRYALRGSTVCSWWTVGLSATSSGSSMKHTSTWMVTFTNRLFLGLAVIVSLAAPTTHSVRVDELRLLP
jgi:hypothetical protein